MKGPPTKAEILHAMWRMLAALDEGGSKEEIAAAAEELREVAEAWDPGAMKTRKP